MLGALGGNALLPLLLLACPVSMMLMMRSMGGRKTGSQEHGSGSAVNQGGRFREDGDGSSAGESRSLADLKAEHAQLAARIETVEAERGAGGPETVEGNH